MNPLKEKIQSGMHICGTHVHLSDPAMCSILGPMGYDFIWIDMEHTCLSYQDVLVHLTAAKASGIPAIVRVPQDDLTATKKVLEMGVSGIVFPMIRTAEEANRLIAATLYPPYGTRGFGPMGAIRYGNDNVDEYITAEHLDICRFIQLEHEDALCSLPELIKNPYIDGYIFGPNDLSGSINELHQVFSPHTRALMAGAIRFLREEKKYIGLSTGDTSEQVIQYWHDLGVQMISAGSDNGSIFEKGLETLHTLRMVQGHV